MRPGSGNRRRAARAAPMLKSPSRAPPCARRRRYSLRYVETQSREKIVAEFRVAMAFDNGHVFGNRAPRRLLSAERIERFDHALDFVRLERPPQRVGAGHGIARGRRLLRDRPHYGEGPLTPRNVDAGHLARLVDAGPNA